MTFVTTELNAPRLDRGALALRAAILCALAAMLAMAWSRNINWDEFYFLSHVHDHLNGRLDRPLQTAFVHGFEWLAWIPGTEAGQIVVARLVMFGFFLGTCLALHRIAAHLTDRNAADIAVLAFVSSGFAIAHGGSFRADPMAACLLMWAVALIMTTRMGAWQIGIMAVSCALALLITVKSALYLPVFLAALIWRWNDRPVIARALLAAGLALVIAGGLFLWHASGISAGEGKAAAENLGEAARVTLGGNGVLPRWPELSFWLVFSCGACGFALAGIRYAPDRRMQMVLVLFALPLLSVLIYRNAFAYFFPFAAPPLMVAVALGALALRGRFAWKLCLLLILACGAVQTVRAVGEGNQAQRATLAEVHRLFPEPVTYIDQNGMIASFPRVGFFMSTWGLATYRAAGNPVFADLIDKTRPPLLLANREELHAALNPAAETGDRLGLLPEDARVLRNAYVHYNGPIWLAGQAATLVNGRTTMQMPFAGTYRLEAEAPVTINGRTIRPGQALALDDDPIDVAGPGGLKVRLFWNTAIGVPGPALPETGLYAGFWHL